VKCIKSLKRILVLKMGWCERPVVGLVIRAANAKFELLEYNFQVLLHQAKLQCSNRITIVPGHVVFDFQNMRSIGCTVNSVQLSKLGVWEGFPE
jgi:hypothetical protein